MGVIKEAGIFTDDDGILRCNICDVKRDKGDKMKKLNFKEDHAEFVNKWNLSRRLLSSVEKVVLDLFVAFLEDKYQVPDHDSLPVIKDEDIPPTPPVKPPRKMSKTEELESLRKQNNELTEDKNFLRLQVSDLMRIIKKNAPVVI